MDEDAGAVLEHAADVLREAELVFLSGRAQPKQELQDAVWRLLAEVLAALAVVQDQTPQEIAEQAFTFAPTDEKWRDDLLPRRREAAQEIDFGANGA